MTHEKAFARWANAFSDTLETFYLRCVRPAPALGDGKGDTEPLLEGIERDSDQIIRVEEQMLLHANAPDESGLAFRKFEDGSCFHGNAWLSSTRKRPRGRLLFVARRG